MIPIIYLKPYWSSIWRLRLSRASLVLGTLDSTDPKGCGRGSMIVIASRARSSIVRGKKDSILGERGCNDGSRSRRSSPSTAQDRGGSDRPTADLQRSI